MRLSRTTLKTLRDIRRSRGQFLAVCTATALGVAIFIASYGSFQNLRHSYDRTYERLAMADAWFDLDNAPLGAADVVKAQPGVTASEGRLVADLPAETPAADNPRILVRFVTLPSEPRIGVHPAVNDVAVVEGGYLSNGSDVLLDQTFAKFNHIHVGDNFRTTAPSGRSLNLTVAGFVVSPEYLFAARNEQEMFSPPSQFGVAFLPYSTLASLLGRQGEVNSIAVTLAQPSAASISSVQALLEKYGPVVATDRANQLSNRLLHLDLDGFRGLAVVFPLLFLIVGSLAVYTLLNRLMQSQRGQIGVMRAMGYSRFSILRHYAGFGLLIGVAGAAIGAIGGWLLADLVTRGYASSLNVPFVVVDSNWVLVVGGFVAGLGVSLLSSLLPAWSAANIPPAEAMRPPAPPRGARSLLERLLPGSRRLPYLLKVPLRNVFRVPRRSLFTALGIAGGVSLALVAASLLDSFDRAVNLEFNSIENYDARVDFASPFPASRLDQLSGVTGVRSAEPIAEVPVRLSSRGRTTEVLIQGLAPDGDLVQVFSSAGDRVRPSDGLLLPSSVASALHVGPGDTAQVRPLSGSAQPAAMRVDGIIEQPLGSVVVTSLQTAGSLLETSAAGTAVVADFGPVDAKEIQQRIYEIEGVTTVQLKKDVRDYIGQFSALFIVFITIMLAFGVALGFAVIFNAVTLTALERQRELATMRVIGTTLGRLVEVLTIENCLVGLAGVAIGIPVGLVIAGYFASLYQNDLIDLPLVIYTRTYLLAAAGALLVVLLAEVPVVRFVRRLNLPQVTRELA